MIPYVSLAERGDIQCSTLVVEYGNMQCLKGSLSATILFFFLSSVLVIVSLKRDYLPIDSIKIELKKQLLSHMTKSFNTVPF